MDDQYRFARRVASLSFVLDTIFQAAALLLEGENRRASPSSSYVAYAPHPFVPLVLFTLGLFIQVMWLMRFWPVFSYARDEINSVEQGLKETLTPLQSPSISSSSSDVPASPPSWPADLKSPATLKETADEDELQSHTVVDLQHSSEDDRVAVTTLNAQMKFLPFYMTGTLCRGCLVFTLATRHFDLSQALAVFYFLVHLYVFFGILGGSRGRRFPQNNVLTHSVVRLRIAVSALYLWKVRGALDIIPPPSTTGTLFISAFFLTLALSTGPDPSLGALLILVLFGFAQGQHHDMEWQFSFTWAGLIVLIFVCLDWFFGIRMRRALGWKISE